MTDKKKKKPSAKESGLRVQHVFDFIVAENQDTAKRLAEQPKVTMAAAVLGFALLDVETQMDLLKTARERLIQK